MKALITALLLLWCCVPAPAARHSVPDLALKDLDGHKQALKALRGNVVVLTFWATWCAPCQEELPRLSRLKSEYEGKPVRFVAVSIDEDKNRAQIASFLQGRDIRLDTWTGATTDTLAAFGMGDIVPATIVLDQDGQPVTRISGEAQNEDVVSRIEWLLNGRPGQAPEAMLIRH